LIAQWLVHPAILRPSPTLSGRVRTSRRRLGALVSAALPFLLSVIAPVVAAARAVATRWPVPPCAGADLRPGPQNSEALASATACLMNQLRRSHHLPALRASSYLQRVATGQVRQMVRLNYFADVAPDGPPSSVLIASSRYAAHAAKLSAGQNIGWGTGDESTPASMVRAWMASPPHRALIMAGAFQDVGVGITQSLPAVLHRGPLGGLYAVEFAAPAG
jgi:uncharacterized protein YkwD